MAFTQLATPVVPVAARLHVPPNCPVELVATPTVPVGVMGELDTSVTVMLQTVAWFTIREPGLQLTLVVVVWRGTTVRVKLGLTLGMWVGSPV